MCMHYNRYHAPFPPPSCGPGTRLEDISKPTFGLLMLYAVALLQILHSNSQHIYVAAVQTFTLLADWRGVHMITHTVIKFALPEFINVIKLMQVR